MQDNPKTEKVSRWLSFLKKVIELILAAIAGAGACWITLLNG